MGVALGEGDVFGVADALGADETSGVEDAFGEVEVSGVALSAGEAEECGAAEGLGDGAASADMPEYIKETAKMADSSCFIHENPPLVY